MPSPLPAKSPPRVVEAVPPAGTERVEEAVRAPNPPPMIMEPEVREVAPVPPLETERVELPVKAEVPFPITISVRVVAPVPPFVAVRALENVTVPVAVSPATEISPENSPLPWTERSRAGVVVPSPRKLLAVNTALKFPEVL